MGRNAFCLKTPADARAACQQLIREASRAQQTGRPGEAERKRSMADYYGWLASELEAEATAAKRQVKCKAQAAE